MNREHRRNMKKNGAGGELRYLNTPCSITEAAQIARGVAEDVVADYANHSRHLQVAISIQVEMLKEIVMKAGLITEEEFREMYMRHAEELNRLQQEVAAQEEEAEDDTPKMEVSVSDVEVKKV